MSLTAKLVPSHMACSLQAHGGVASESWKVHNRTGAQDVEEQMRHEYEHRRLPLTQGKSKVKVFLGMTCTTSHAFKSRQLQRTTINMCKEKARNIRGGNI